MLLKEYVIAPICTPLIREFGFAMNNELAANPFLPMNTKPNEANELWYKKLRRELLLLFLLLFDIVFILNM